jgi:hypothetical protein
MLARLRGLPQNATTPKSVSHSMYGSPRRELRNAPMLPITNVLGVGVLVMVKNYGTLLRSTRSNLLLRTGGSRRRDEINLR